MTLRCFFFGHSPPVYAERGWWSPGEQYGEVLVGARDGIGRIHATVHAKCARCNKKFMLVRIHLPITLDENA